MAVVIEPEKVINSHTYTYLERKERRHWMRLLGKNSGSAALARVDAHREELTGELEELEAAERVLVRYGKCMRPRKTASAWMPHQPPGPLGRFA